MWNRDTVTAQVALALCLVLLVTAARSAPSLCDLDQCACAQNILTCACNNYHNQVELRHGQYKFIPYFIAKIKVINCRTVSISKRSIENVTSLIEVKLENIADLRLEEQSFSSRVHYGPRVRIEIVNCNISKIPNNAFEGHLDTILISNSRINNVQSFAFSSLHDMELLKFKDTSIANFDQQALKNFMVNHFVMEGGSVDIMNSYTIKDLKVQKDMKFQGVTFGLVKTLAVTAIGPSALRIEECIFQILETEAFKVHTKGPVFINDNIVKDLRMGALVGITLESSFFAHNEKQELVFENNTITRPNSEVIVFNTTGLKPRIERLVLQVKCSCKDVRNWQTGLVKFKDRTVVTPDVSKQTWCFDNNKEVTVSQYYERQCKSSHTTLYVVIGLSVTAAALAALCVAGILFYRKYKRMKRQVRRSNTINENRFSTYSNASNHIIVLPSSKTYLETEIDDFKEEVQPLKNSHNDLSGLKVTGL